MNRIAIFYLLALFCISITLAQADRERFRTVKLAIVIDPRNSQNSHTYDEGEVVIYKTRRANGEDVYNVGDSSGKLSLTFKVQEYRTVVTEEVISIEYGSLIITLTVNENTSTFNLYRDLCPFGNFTRDFSVRGTFGRAERFDKVSVKFQENRAGGEWIFMAQNGNTPRLIFPSYRGTLNPVSDIRAVKKFSVDLKANTVIPITFEFDNPDEAEAFYDMKAIHRFRI